MLSVEAGILTGARTCRNAGLDTGFQDYRVKGSPFNFQGRAGVFVIENSFISAPIYKTLIFFFVSDLGLLQDMSI